MADTSNWSRENMAWAAGLFEGEGSISIKKQATQLALGMTDEDVVRKFRGIVGMGNVHGPYQDKRKATHKPMWIWAVSGGQRTQALLAAFWPFLGSRRQEKIKQALVAYASRKVHGMDKTHCYRGHEFNEANTYVEDSRRRCRKCMKIRSDAYRERLRAVA